MSKFKQSVKEYEHVHKNKVNLFLHYIFVPLFWCGSLGVICSTISLSLIGCIVSIVLMVTSLSFQALGHKQEMNSPKKFKNFFDAVKRIVKEQFCTFPLFVFLHVKRRSNVMKNK